MPGNSAVPMALRAPDKCSAPPVLVAPANDRALWCFRRKGVSWNRGTPKSSISIWFSITNHPFWGASIYGNPHTTMSLKIRDLPQDMATRMRRWWSTKGCWSTLFSDKPVQTNPYLEQTINQLQSLTALTWKPCFIATGNLDVIPATMAPHLSTGAAHPSKGSHFHGQHLMPIHYRIEFQHVS